MNAPLDAVVVNATHWIEPLNAHQFLYAIVESESGNCKTIPIKTTKRDLTDALKKFGADRVIATYLRLTAREAWSPLYKPASRRLAF